MARTTVDRERVEVVGAAAVLDDFRRRLTAGTPAGLAAARSLVDGEIDWHSAHETIVAAERSVILAEQDSGPILAARVLSPTALAAIHDHGHAGAALVVAGRGRYERFRRSSNTTATLESVHELAEGDVIWWNAPPDDVHRQRGLEVGAIELVVMGRRPLSIREFADVTPPASALRTAVVDAILHGDAERLAPWYDDRVFVDANVPEWRFQIQGRQSFLDLIDHDEFRKPNRRITFVRATDTAEGLLVETETRFTDNGELRVCREAHNLRVRDERVVEHVLWCTGIAFASTARKQFETAPMERA